MNRTLLKVFTRLETIYPSYIGRGIFYNLITSTDPQYHLRDGNIGKT